MIHILNLTNLAFSSSISVITSSYSVEAPEFLDQITNVTVPSGRDTVLECTVNNLGTYKVIIVIILVLFHSVITSKKISENISYFNTYCE